MSSDFIIKDQGNELRVMVDGQSIPRWHGARPWTSTPLMELTPEPAIIKFVLTDEQLENFHLVAEKLSETFRNFLDGASQVVSNLYETLKALGAFDIDWDAINAQAEAAERAHAKRFKMYQRRYERGKAR